MAVTQNDIIVLENSLKNLNNYLRQAVTAINTEMQKISVQIKLIKTKTTEG
jgi:hypothetical protein